METFKKSWKIFLIFLKIGSFTFGGGMAMLPLIQKEVVDKQKWVKEEDIIDIFALSQSLPGVIAINSAIFVGNRVCGIFGAIAAVLGVNLPALLSILLVIMALTSIKDNPYVPKIFGGVKAASAALILLSAIKLAKSSIKDKKGIIIAIASFSIIIVLQINAVWAIIFGGVTGYFMYLFSRRHT